ncbi:hypothetical protein ONZ45_g5909 [Pleurotus djamor]|nr:hypothetical protein ONZ45_g5909 [Pleurotus djamor]
MALENDLIDVASEHFYDDDDTRIQGEDEMDRDIPPRPNSRLGFNGDDDDEDEESCNDFDEVGPLGHRFTGGITDWTLGVSGRELSILDTEGDAHLSGTDDIGSDDEGEDAGYGSCGLQYSSGAPPQSPPLPSAPPPSQLALMDEEVFQPFSCLPSPLSPCYVNEPHPLRSKSPTLPRCDLRHHGRSRNALVHTKWFWSMRGEEWSEIEELDSQGADKLSKSPTIRQSLPTLPHHTGGLKKKTPKLKQTSRFSPLSVHPRRGDVSALRDPYCAHVDRSLAEWPMWTIAKTLWMFDVQMGLDMRKKKSKELGGDEDMISDEEQSDESSGPCVRTTREARSLSTSSGFSDDSDITLVESDVDVDEDLEQIEEDATLDDIDETSGPPDEDQVEVISTPRPSDLPSHKSPSPSLKSSPKSMSKTSLSPHAKPRHLTRPPYYSPNFPSLATYIGSRHNKLQDDLWETDSYSRWDLLIDIVRLDHDAPSHHHYHHHHHHHMSSSPRASGSHSRRFYLAHENDESNDDIFGPSGSSTLPASLSRLC